MPPRKRLITHVSPPRRTVLPLGTMCLLLAMVLLAIPIVGRPSTWDWMFPNASGQAAAGPDVASAVKVEVVSRGTAADVEQQADIDAGLWERIEERQVGLLRQEQDVVEALLAAASELPQQAVGEAGLANVPIADLKQRPEEFRGELLRIEGTVRRLQRCNERLTPDPEGELYDAWVFTEESGTMPWRVIAPTISGDLRPGIEISIPARTSGYFFKLMGYATPGGAAVAPVLIAPGWKVSAAAAPATPPVRRIGPPSARSTLLLMAGAAIVLSLAVRLFIPRLPKRPRDAGVPPANPWGGPDDPAAVENPPGGP
ncbi:MAG: hypothetical protein KF774_14435 [Planctomyces sp.]|nr:hypothetical protein [Planctomyces sp.]